MNNRDKESIQKLCEYAVFMHNGEWPDPDLEYEVEKILQSYGWSFSEEWFYNKYFKDE